MFVHDGEVCGPEKSITVYLIRTLSDFVSRLGQVDSYALQSKHRQYHLLE